MITVPAGVRVYLAMGPTDMRRGFDGLSMQVQELLKLDPFSGHLFAFRGRRGGLVKILVWGLQCQEQNMRQTPLSFFAPSPPHRGPRRGGGVQCLWEGARTQEEYNTTRGGARFD